MKRCRLARVACGDKIGAAVSRGVLSVPLVHSVAPGEPPFDETRAIVKVSGSLPMESSTKAAAPAKSKSLIGVNPAA